MTDQIITSEQIAQAGANANANGHATGAEQVRRRDEARAAVLRASALLGHDDEAAFGVFCAAFDVSPDDEALQRVVFTDSYARARAACSAAPAAAEPLARRLDIHALLDAPLEPIPWRVDRFAADGAVTVLAGHGGEGKSWLALALAIGVACGSTVGGLRCASGRALYLDGENGERLIARRYRAADGPRENLAVYENTTVDLATDAGARWLREAIEREQSQLVVLDSLRSLAPQLEENNGDTVAPVMRSVRVAARETGAAIVLLHHRPKNTGAAYRGSSVLRDQADMLVVLGREANDPEARTRRYLHADGARGGKFRIDAEPPERWFHLRPHGEYVTIDAADAFLRGAQDRTPTREATEAAEIAELLERDAEGLSTAAICRALGKKSETDGTTRRAVALLAEAGTIQRRDGGHGPWVHVDHLPPTLGEGVASHGGNPAGNPAGGVASQPPIGGAGSGNPASRRQGHEVAGPANALTADVNDGRPW